MSVSLGDILSIRQLAIGVATKFIDAPEQFQSAREQVNQTRHILDHLARVAKNNPYCFEPEGTAEAVDYVCESFRDVLMKLDVIVPNGRGGWWQRFTYSSNDINTLCLRLAEHTNRLSVHLNLVVIDELGKFGGSLSNMEEHHKLIMKGILEISEKIQLYEPQGSNDQPRLMHPNFAQLAEYSPKLLPSSQLAQPTRSTESLSLKNDSADAGVFKIGQIQKSDPCAWEVRQQAAGKPSFLSKGQLQKFIATHGDLAIPALSPNKITVFTILLKTCVSTVPASRLWGDLLAFSPYIDRLLHPTSEPEFVSTVSPGQIITRLKFVCGLLDSTANLLEFCNAESSSSFCTFFMKSQLQLVPNDSLLVSFLHDGDTMTAFEIPKIRDADFGTNLGYRSKAEIAVKTKIVTEEDPEWEQALKAYLEKS